MTARSLGERGEALAARHLEQAGWTILGRNVRMGRKEIDLVAHRDGVVAFVEVKTRSGSGFGHPLDAITWKKRREIQQVAAAWIERHARPHFRTYRFDAVAVHVRAGGAEPLVEHVPDAWRMSR